MSTSARKLRTDAADPASAQHPDYLQLNVQGKVPTLRIDGLVLTESIAILHYIALRTGIWSASQRQHGCLCPA